MFVQTNNLFFTPAMAVTWSKWACRYQEWRSVSVDKYGEGPFEVVRVEDDVSGFAGHPQLVTIALPDGKTEYFSGIYFQI